MTELDRIRVMVVDDEPLARGMVREMLESDPIAEIVGECSNGRDAISAIKSLSPDVIFLDVQMPEFGGFDVLESFQNEHLPRVIFVTAYDQYAVRAFEVHALDYLLKPFDQERFNSTLDRAKQHLTHQNSADETRSRIQEFLRESRGPHLQRFIIRTPNRIFFLPAKEVDWIEAQGNYV